MSRVLPLSLSLVLAVPAAALPILAAPEADLVRDGGVIGGVLTYSMQGDPGQIWGLALSTTTGPTPLAIFDASDPRLLEVGLDLVSLWQLGFLDGAGQAVLALPVPPLPSLQGVPLHAQMVTVPGATTLIDEVSNRTSVVLGEPQSSVLTPFLNVAELNAHTATALEDGNVLLAGGILLESEQATNGYRLYDEQAGEFSTLTATMVAKRTQHTATRLADGRVLTLGGSDENNVVHASGEIFDPTTGLSTPITPMSVPRVGHTATLLPDGRVFVAGGTSSFDFSDPLGALSAVHLSTALYDPATNTWSNGPNLPKKRALHSATLTGAGQVLITGGIELTNLIFIELPDFSSDSRRYNPPTNTILSTPSFATARAMHGQLTLANGDVLLGGGVNGDLIAQTFDPLASVRLYDTSANAWASVASMGVTRVQPGFFEIGGDVIAIGGLSSFDLVAGTGTGAVAIEATTPAVGAWTQVATTVLPRFFAVSALVGGAERILTTGSGDNGSGGTVPDFTAETYVP
jgi:hypothetical protein